MTRQSRRIPAFGLGCCALLLCLGSTSSLVATDLTSGAHEQCSWCHAGSPSVPDPFGPTSNRPDASVCRECHAAKSGDDALAARYDPSAKGLSGHLEASGVTPPGGFVLIHQLDCMTCHAPHANGRAHQLREVDAAVAAVSTPGARVDATTAYCLGCHVKFGETGGFGNHYTRHPVGLRVAASRREARPGLHLPLLDVRGTLETADDVIGCTTCHLTHASSNRYLLRWPPEQQIEACTSCHRVGPPRNASGLMAAGRRLR